MTAGATGIALSGVFSANPVLAIAFLSIGTLGVGSMPLFWPMPSAFPYRTAWPRASASSIPSAIRRLYRP
jgi:hypothetical protein